ncbi:sugar ABC transporter ATP-binding protein [Acidisoma silvae]|uniref:Sugar ABC transporter ATP-binding protein n=1 Tax=Acidisoma silvae TaxID=2802396 RepID=A0A963YWR2_9PROT|nr:sugar ABC transporter ATP-binding protein [Acidisoma silvae]MCB8877767.1 sugar ABC transporter ATP-binding protein [Acidisoma silvae]
MLTVEHISKRYGPVQALRDVSIDVRPHEVVGLIGENGAGKSTLMRILAGTVQPDQGVIRVNGTAVTLRDSRHAKACGIAMVFQEQSLLLNMTVAENLHLTQEGEFTRMGLLQKRRMNAAARAHLSRVGLDVDPRTQVGELTFAARQMVELAKALALEERTTAPLTIFLDEPTSVLETRDIGILFDRMRSLKSRASFIFVSHRLDEVLQISDRVYVMKDGAVVAERPADAVTVSELHEMMVGQELHAGYYREDRQGLPQEGEPALEARGLTVRGVFQGVDFALRRGEVLGVAGVIGSGREELMRTLFGFLPQTAGTLTVNGRDLVLRSPTEAVAAGIGYIPRERRLEGLVMDLSVAVNMTLANLDVAMSRNIIDRTRERAIAKDWIERLHIRTPNANQVCRNLSGGNQQKIVLARWMTAKSRILILDHPTRGLDVGAKGEVYDLIRALSEDGASIILTSDTLEETIGLCHTILVMRDGSITGRFDAPAGAKPSQVALLEQMV